GHRPGLSADSLSCKLLACQSSIGEFTSGSHIRERERAGARGRVLILIVLLIVFLIVIFLLIFLFFGDLPWPFCRRSCLHFNLKMKRPWPHPEPLCARAG